MVYVFLIDDFMLYGVAPIESCKGAKENMIIYFF